uniref:Uncharacterized protein n=1 Tax=Timema tahoe TaxID=61484 RepID=A0A7R9NV07_9NEOP|nr:unnamed protein product [Timema tahoe]
MAAVLSTSRSQDETLDPLIAVCDRDVEQGYFGPIPALPVTERRRTSLLRTCYSVYLIRGAVTKRNSSFRLSGTGCECDVRGAVTKKQVVISQPIPSITLATTTWRTLE